MSDPADAAKLLPVPNTDPIKDCPRCGGTHVGTPGWCPITQEPPPGWEPRPQPAPPEGEPDFEKEGAALFSKCMTRVGWDWRSMAIEFGRRMYRLGLAARPKVEDAEEMLPISITSAVTAKAKEWKDRAEAAEAKLAEREAELANAYSELDWIARHDKQDMEFGPTMSLARKSVAARQQQKDKV